MNIMILDNFVMSFFTELIKNKNKHKDPQAEIIKIPRPFENINKWSTADIYFASDAAKKEIANMITEKKLDYTKLNAFISKMISSGDILPLSLKNVAENCTPGTVFA